MPVTAPMAVERFGARAVTCGSTTVMELQPGVDGPGVWQVAIAPAAVLVPPVGCDRRRPFRCADRPALYSRVPVWRDLLGAPAVAHGGPRQG